MVHLLKQVIVKKNGKDDDKEKMLKNNHIDRYD